MAIWQFDLLFVPVGAALPAVTDEGVCTVPIGEKHCALAMRLLSEMLEPATEMMDGWFMFGQESGNRFDVLVDEGEISARVDAREQPEKLLTLICRLAAKLDCLIYSLEFAQFIEPEPKALHQALVLSRAASFVRDPAKVLLGMGDA